MKSDSELQRDVLVELNWLPNIDAAHIGVAAEAGVVTLTGQVDHYTEKVASEDAVKAVYGVKGIANDIQVTPPDSDSHTDKDITQAVLSALQWDYEVPADRISVTVKQGSVTLDGSVDWQYQKDAAARLARYLNGVKTVANLINITPRVRSSDIAKQIEDAFGRKAVLDARRIDVSASDGNVTLQGSVSSWSERDEAVETAWAAPGVMSVKDQLSIVP
jgi:osmotically-inducible protein OsmY